MLWVKAIVSQNRKIILRPFNVSVTTGNKKAEDMGLKVFIEIKQ